MPICMRAQRHSTLPLDSARNVQFVLVCATEKLFIIDPIFPVLFCSNLIRPHPRHPFDPAIPADATLPSFPSHTSNRILR